MSTGLYPTLAKNTGPHVVDLANLPTLAGQRLGSSDWHPVTQEQVNQFAVTTGDGQWIHVEPERARSGPFAATVAHGCLTMSLATKLLNEIIRVSG